MGGGRKGEDKKQMRVWSEEELEPGLVLKNNLAVVFRVQKKWRQYEED